MVDIIIPCYNYGRFISDCIESCLCQDNSRIIVVDDGSGWETKEVLKLFKDQVLLITFPENKGVSYARNEGIKASNGEYIALLDSDDMLAPNSVTARSNYLTINPDVDIVCGRALKVQGEVSYQESVRRIATLPIHPSKLHTQTFMYRRSVFDRFGLYYEGLRTSEDTEMKWRLGIHRNTPLKKVVKIKSINEAVAFYRRHEEAKRKKRKNNLELDVKTQMIFDARIQQLKREGITKKNTRFI